MDDSTEVRLTRGFLMTQRRCYINQARSIEKALGIEDDLLSSARKVARLHPTEGHPNSCKCEYCTLHDALKKRD